MTRNTQRLLSIITFLFMFCSLANQGEVFADSTQEGKLVSAIEVQGNTTVSDQTITSQIRTIAGRPLTTQQLSEDLKRLYSLGYFKDVQIRQKPDGEKVRVIFIVKEKTILTEISIEGNYKINAKDIEKEMKAKVGDFVDEQMIRRDSDAIGKLYEKKGFYDATVTYKIDYDHTNNQARLSIQVDEGTKITIKEIAFEGVYWLKPADITSKIQTKQHAWWGIVSGNLKDHELELDIQRIRALYDEEGFSDAKVSYRLEEVGEPGHMRLVFIVEEGQQYLVGDVKIEGNTLFTSEELTEAMELKPGSPFSRRGLRQSVTNIQDLYFAKGYMNARVVFDSVYNEQTDRVDTLYRVTENDITYVNRVKVIGNTKTQDIVIRRELRVYPGEPFDGAALKRSKERLFNLGYFEEVQFDTEDTKDPDYKDLVVTVKEQKTGEFSFGGGFSSIDKAVGFVQIRQRNFDFGDWPSFTGAGQDLAMRLNIGSVRSQGEISWTDPWFMGYPFSLGFDVFRREFDRTRSSGLFFDEERTGGRLRIGKELTDFDSINWFYGYENVEISDIPDTASADLRAEEGETNLSRTGLTVTRDTRDNKFVPTQGYILQGTGELVGGFIGGDRDFWRSTGMAAGYWEHWKDNVLELKLRGGISDAYGDSEKVPIFERFYAGGANTIRGYRERRIGPRDAGTNDPVGGEAYWVANTEYTFPVYPNVIKGAVFYDVGNVHEKIEDVGEFDEVFQGIGLGVRLNTPIGPVKVDAGYPLDNVEGEDKEVRFYFNMSRGF